MSTVYEATLEFFNYSFKPNNFKFSEDKKADITLTMFIVNNDESDEDDEEVILDFIDKMYEKIINDKKLLGEIYSYCIIDDFDVNLCDEKSLKQYILNNIDVNINFVDELKIFRRK